MDKHDFKKGPSAESTKKKPHVLRSFKRFGIMLTFHDLNAKLTMRRKRIKRFTILFHGKTVIIIIITIDPNTMTSNARARSSSPCPSSPETTIPKSAFHGH